MSCAVWVGFERPLATVSNPEELGSKRMMASGSFACTLQPDGRGMVKPSFDSVPFPAVDVGDAMGLGVTPGVGLGRSPVPELAVGLGWLTIRASAVPPPARTTTSATTADTIIVRDVRWTGTGAPYGA